MASVSEFVLQRGTRVSENPNQKKKKINCFFRGRDDLSKCIFFFTMNSNLKKNSVYGGGGGGGGGGRRMLE